MSDDTHQSQQSCIRCGSPLPGELGYVLEHDTYTCGCGQRYYFRATPMLQMIRSWSGAKQKSENTDEETP